MRLLTFAVAATPVLCASLFCVSAGAAENQSGFYLSVSPGRYVDYLSLSDSGHDVTGYLESIRVSAGSPGGLARTQTFVSVHGNGSVVVFGNRTATRVGDAYTLTYPTSTGLLTQQRFVRSTVERVNGSISDLTATVSRNQAQAALDVTKAELSQDTHVTSAQAIRLAQAQASIDAARAQQTELQRKADGLWSVARKLRIDANAAINSPGASFAQNQKSIGAMKLADDAAQSARAAQHDADAAGYTATIAESDLANLRSSIATLVQRARFLNERLKANGQTSSPP